MFVDQNQIYPQNTILGGPKKDEWMSGLQATWILVRSMLRKQKIERIYGTKNTDRKEKF